MKMAERIALAKAGYKKSEIEALEREEKEEDLPKEEEKEELPKEEEKEEELPEEEKEDEIDFKKLYEDEVKKLADTKKKLEEAQKRNTKNDIESEIQSDEDILANMVQDFY